MGKLFKFKKREKDLNDCSVIDVKTNPMTTPATPYRAQLRHESQIKLRKLVPELLHLKGRPVSTVKQLASATGLSCTAIYQALHRGKIREITVSNVGKLIDVEEFIKYLDKPLGRPRKDIEATTIND
jgi:hypothetical protein